LDSIADLHFPTGVDAGLRWQVCERVEFAVGTERLGPGAQPVHEADFVEDVLAG